ncbi:hypothetical protein MBLNU459_g6510t1 [Dothideomycetes sp. NU459]
MWPISVKPEYHALATDDEELGKADTSELKRNRCPGPVFIFLWITIIFLGIVAIIFSAWDPTGHVPAKAFNGIDEATSVFPDHEPASSAPTSSCGASLSVRREWRTLSRPEQTHYIDSVRCLLDQPSSLSANWSSYDDFPFIHSRVGWYTHHAAPFLPWHRYFLHIYETTLRQQCGFTGDLVYWDWSLDADNLASSVLFDSETGFGGDGDAHGETTVGTTGRCVVDGPFADVIAEYYDTKKQPHCLSRGFHDDSGTLGHIDGQDISPESIEEVLRIEEYEGFVAALEAKVHDVIPFGIGGDFETFTAPYDPLFFLHHTQLDRIWWIWQQRNPEQRIRAYGGRNSRHSIAVASLEDALKMKGLAPTIKVEEVMNTEDELLCYRY